MAITSNPNLERSLEANYVCQLRRGSVIISILVICLGISVIVGWLGEIDFLKSVIAQRVTMKVSTALGLILGGISLLLWHQQQQRNSLMVAVELYGLPLMAIAFSLITLVE